MLLRQLRQIAYTAQVFHNSCRKLVVQSTGASVCVVLGHGSHIDWMQTFYFVDSSSDNTNTTVFHRFIPIIFTYE